MTKNALQVSAAGDGQGSEWTRFKIFVQSDEPKKERKKERKFTKRKKNNERKVRTEKSEGINGQK